MKNTPCIIIPFRDRDDHWNLFQDAIYHYLRSTMDYKIIRIDQEPGKPFNRGMLINIGYNECKRLYPECSYIITHDVDMIPVDVDYSFSHVCHLASACSQFGYKMPYPDYFGGVNVFSIPAFEKINGFSNKFWGWGAEDDDLLGRVYKHKLEIERRYGRFESLPHERNVSASLHARNVALLDMSKQGRDVKSGLDDLKYEIKATSELRNGCCIEVKI